MATSVLRNPVFRRISLLGPALIFIGVFMLLPIALMAYVSFLERGEYGGVVWGAHTAEAYVNFLLERDLDGSLIPNTDYLQIFMRSLGLAVITWFLAIVVGFPTALYMALQPERFRNLLIFLVTIPFWTNLLVRNYAWILLLRNNGLIDASLADLGLTSEPISLLYTPFAIGVGLTYSFLPFMVLPIYASLEKVDLRLVEAAFDLGANHLKALMRVIIPLALPGIMAGSILVLIPCLGAYVTPELLGGSKSMMIGNLIQTQFGAARNWPFGAALAFVLLAMVLITMMIYTMRFKRGPESVS